METVDWLDWLFEAMTEGPSGVLCSLALLSGFSAIFFLIRLYNDMSLRFGWSVVIGEDILFSSRGGTPGVVQWGTMCPGQPPIVISSPQADHRTYVSDSPGAKR
jgi:hypothetical protein